MANRTISIAWKLEAGDGGFKKLVMDAKDFENALGGVAKRVEKLNVNRINFTHLAQGIEVATKSLNDITGMLSDLSAAYAVQEEVETKLATVMRQRMNATDEAIQSIKDFCSEQQNLGIIGDEVQLAGAQQLSTFLKTEGALKTLIPAMNNLVAQQKGLNSTGGDAVNIGNLLGKALQGQTAALRRVGITFTEAEEKAVKFGTEEERAAALAQIITNNVGDMNAKLAQTPSGQMKQVANALGDVKEKIGALASQIMPAVTTLNQMVLAVGSIAKIRAGVLAATTAFQKMIVPIRGVTVAATAMKLAFGGIAFAAIGLAIYGITKYVNSCTEATRKMKAAQVAVNNVRREAASQLAEQELKIRTLIKAAQDETKSLSERNAACSKLNSIIPNYNAHLDETTKKYRANKEALDEYLISLRKQYELEGAKEQLKTLSGERAKSLVDLNQAKTEYRDVLRDQDAKKKANEGKTITDNEKALLTQGVGIFGVIGYHLGGKVRDASDASDAKNKVTEARDTYNEKDAQFQGMIKLISSLENEGIKTTPEPPGGSGSFAKGGGGRSSAEPVAPEGSLADLEKRIRTIDTDIEVTVDPGRLDELIAKREELIRQKAELEKGIDAQVNLVRDRDQLKELTQDPALEVTVPVNVDLGELQSTLQELPAAFNGISAAIQNSVRRTRALNQAMAGLPSLANAAAGAFRGLGDAFDSKELNVAGIIAGAIANIIAGYGSATAQASEMGPWAWVAFALAGLAVVAAVVAQVKSLTAFADGGIVSGPTMALVGEYAGASSNPEVIAPLDKLRDMINTAPGMAAPAGSVRFEIDGTKLVGVLENTTRIAARGGRRLKI